MKRLNNLISLGTLGICFQLLIMSGILKGAPKNYYFPEVRINISIEKDGSFIVDEYRTYDFEGTFTWATLWIPLRVIRHGYRYDIRIEDFDVFDEKGSDLEKEITRVEEKFEAKWFYRAKNERRIFHIHYRIRDGIVSYPDASELYWRIIGSGWDAPARNVFINLHLPEGIEKREDILVYGHGPLSGRAKILDKRTAQFTATNLASGQFLEIRVLWPPGLVEGVLSNRRTLESIQQEEALFVQKTIELVKRAQAKKERRKKISFRIIFIWGGLLVVITLIWLLMYWHSWKKVGKDYRFDDIPEYFRELPSKLSPALVEVLVREGGAATPRSFTATLFDLARRGYVEIKDHTVERKTLPWRKEEFETTIICLKEFQEDPELFPYERDLLELLFIAVGKQRSEKGSRLQLDELKDYFKKKPRKFQKWYKEWLKNVQSESKKLEFIEPKSTKMRNLFMAVTIPLAIITLNPVLVIMAGILIPKIKRRARHWARENELWKALDRFLDDFSSFEEVPPEAYKLWEHYLVFGIIFGNAKKIIEMLPVIIQDERAISPLWYHGFERASFISTGRIESMINSIESMSTSIQQASAAAAHYSSGSAGGFSAGGGGGGGGGGGSAG